MLFFATSCHDPRMIPSGHHLQSALVNTSDPPLYSIVVPRSGSGSGYNKRRPAIGQERELIQQALAGPIGGLVQRLKRCKARSSQPTIEGIRKRATERGGVSDQLPFGAVEHSPARGPLLRLEAVIP